MMGGAIRAESEPGRGSCFSFEVCVQAGASQSSLVSGRTESEPARRAVLIVEANAVAREILMRHCSSWGLEPQSVAWVAEAVDWLARGQPADLAIVALRQEGGDVETLVRRLREQPGRAELPILLLPFIGASVSMPAGLGVVGQVTKP
jgi:CheY-like chemotaxis protein